MNYVFMYLRYRKLGKQLLMLEDYHRTTAKENQVNNLKQQGKSTISIFQILYQMLNLKTFKFIDIWYLPTKGQFL